MLVQNKPKPLSAERKAEIRHKLNSMRAYRLWEEAGKPAGRDEEFWLAAEKQMTAERKDVSQGMRRYLTVQAHGLKADDPRARRIDGNVVADAILDEVKADIERQGRSPVLGVVMVGGDLASLAYIERKRAACERVGATLKLFHYLDDIRVNRLAHEVGEITKAKEVDGLIVQLPLPGDLNRHRDIVLDEIPVGIEV